MELAKTTLAKYIYNSNWENFENQGFLEDIDRRCKESQDFIELQEQLSKDILGGKGEKYRVFLKLHVRLRRSYIQKGRLLF